MKRFLMLLYAFALSSSCGFAQSTAIADIQQDFALIKREVAQLRLEVEQLRAENERLAQQLNQAQGSESAAQLAATLRSEFNSRDEAVKRDILNQVKRELEELTGQTNISLEKITRAINARPTASPQQTFSKDYPQNGITHVVVSGDTLSAIARKYGSRVKWIQDANEIADPSRGLQVGKTIFVPRE